MKCEEIDIINNSLKKSNNKIIKDKLNSNRHLEKNKIFFSDSLFNSNINGLDIDLN